MLKQLTQPNTKSSSTCIGFQHSNVAGNEKADEEAKKTIYGNSSPNHMLPFILREPLPISIPTMKQEQPRSL